MDARGIKPEMLADGCHRSSMDELTAWTRSADRVLVFCRIETTKLDRIMIPAH
jgi:hypothetical protein